MVEEKENVVIVTAQTGLLDSMVLRAGDCSLTIFPALGGKIGSLLVNGHELLQTPLKPYAARTRIMAFADGDASGWDECLPSVADCLVELAGMATGSAAVPDHGDLWRVPWEVLSANSDSALMRADCFSLPLRLTRSTLLSETETGWRIQLLYSLTNMTAHLLPWAWSAHPGFASAAGDRILLPDDVRQLRLEGSGGNRLGTHGNLVAWPQATLTDSSQADLSTVQDAASQVGDKLFAGPLREGWCSLERAAIGLRLTVRFEPELTPYLGLWICSGGWPEGEGEKQMCVAMEPTTAPVDSLAETGSWSRQLEPGETFSCRWNLKLND